MYGSNAPFHYVDKDGVAQSFTTGDDEGGYYLASAQLFVKKKPFYESDLKVEVKTSKATGCGSHATCPGDKLITLTNPANLGVQFQTFTANDDIHLEANTEYFVFVWYDTFTSDRAELRVTDPNHDSTSSYGWTIPNERLDNSGGNWYTDGEALALSIRGTVAPSAADNTVTTLEDTAYVFGAGDFGFVGANDTDTLDHVKITSLPGTDYGALSFDDQSIDSNDLPNDVTKQALDDGKLAYTPPDNANGDGFATFKFKVSNGTNDSIEYTITIGVTAVNDAPTAVDDAASTAEDTAVDIDVVGNDTDPEEDILSVTLVTTPGNGTAVATSGSTTDVTYTPNPDFNGTDSFSYTVSDDQTPPLTATGMVTVTVTAVNDPPTFPQTESGSRRVPEGAFAGYQVGGPVAAVDVDEGDSLTYSFHDGPDGAPFAIAQLTGQITVGTDLSEDDVANSPYSYTVRATDGSDSFADIRVSIKVDRHPVAGDDTAIVPEGGWVDIDIAANDTDADGDTLSVIGVGAGPGSPANGSAVIKDGSTTGVTYTPNAGFIGDDSFTYGVSDGLTTVTGTVTVNVYAAPSATVAVDGSVEIDVLENAAYPAGGSLSVTVTDETEGVTATIKDGSPTVVVYTPAADFFSRPSFDGIDSFGYTVSDAAGSFTAGGRVTVLVFNPPTPPPPPDAPPAAPLPATVTYDAVPKGTPKIVETAEVGQTVEFPQGAITPFQVKVDSAPENCGSGPLGQRLTECTQVDIFDLDGSDLDTDTAPFVSAKITLTVRAARGIRVFRRDNAGDEWTEIQRCGAETTTECFEESGNRVTIHNIGNFSQFAVTTPPPRPLPLPPPAVNNPPAVAAAIPDQVTIVGSPPLVIAAADSFFDADGDDLTYSAESSDEAVVTVVVARGNRIAVRSPGVGTATITVTAMDRRGATASVAFTVTVTARNAAPVAVAALADQTLVMDGAAIELAIGGVFSDADGDGLTLMVDSSDESVATAALSGDSVSVAPVRPGIAVIRVTATDPAGDSAVQQFAVTVESAPAAPEPTVAPTPAPTATAAPSPTAAPTAAPSPAETAVPTAAPTPPPTTPAATATPTQAATPRPTAVAVPTPLPEPTPGAPSSEAGGQIAEGGFPLWGIILIAAAAVVAATGALAVAVRRR